MIPLAKLHPYPAEPVMPSPNHNERRASGIWGVVVHATADAGNEIGTLEWLTNPAAQASCHLLIRRSGSIVRLVEDRDRAWHAGRSEWRGTEDVNSVTLGVELCNRNDGREPYTAAQYASLAHVAVHYIGQGLSLADFVSHAEVARPVGRKTDPAGFEWTRFRRTVQDLLAPLADPALLPLNLKTIAHPTPRHIEEICRVRRLSVAEVLPGLRVAEVLSRGVAEGRQAGAKEIADAEADYIKAHR